MRSVTLALLLLPSLLGCSIIETPRTLRGHLVDPDSLSELVVGTSTKKDVTSLIGSPTTRSTFDDNQWVYISETTHMRIGLTPGVLKQNVTVLTFDDAGVLRGIKQLNQGDGRDVAMAGGATPSPGSDASFLQQLLGNVGRYNVQGVGTSQDNAPGGGIGSSRGLRHLNLGERAVSLTDKAILAAFQAGCLLLESRYAEAGLVVRHRPCYLVFSGVGPCSTHLPPYEPENVVLIGTVSRTMAYGPPGFGETPRVDSKEPFLSLDLSAPICVSQGDAEDQPAENAIRHLQILFEDRPFDRTLVGRRIQITGQLRHAFSGHHHTTVMIELIKVERLSH